MDSIDKLARILRESKNAVFFGGQDLKYEIGEGC